VRVTGSLKMFGPKRYINATAIRLVDARDEHKNKHEIYFHMFEVITSTLLIERGAVSLRVARATLVC
jgi:hypothetical protein